MSVRRLSTRTRRLALAACLATVTTAFAGCAEQPATGPRGPLSSVSVDGIVYTVRSARVLNPGDAEDRLFLDGRRPDPGRSFVGLFLVMCNDAPSPRRSSDDLRLVTPSGFTASRIENEDSPFAYEPRPLGPGQCAPRAISAPGRAADALLALFEVPQDAAARRPLDFGVESVDGSVRRVRVVDVGE